MQNILREIDDKSLEKELQSQRKDIKSQIMNGEFDASLGSKKLSETIEQLKKEYSFGSYFLIIAKFKVEDTGAYPGRVRYLIPAVPDADHVMKLMDCWERSFQVTKTGEHTIAFEVDTEGKSADRINQEAVRIVEQLQTIVSKGNQAVNSHNSILESDGPESWFVLRQSHINSMQEIVSNLQQNVDRLPHG